jgi:hypothetical protein
MSYVKEISVIKGSKKYVPLVAAVLLESNTCCSAGPQPFVIRNFKTQIL